MTSASRPGDIAPLGVEGSEIAVAGRLADLIARLACIADDMRTADRRCVVATPCREAIGQLYRKSTNQRWQLDQLRRIIAEIGDQATVGGEPATVEITLQDVRRILAERISGLLAPPRLFPGRSHS